MKNLLLISLLIFSSPLLAQDNHSSMPDNTNAFYGNLGFLAGPVVSLNYEHIIRPFKKNENKLLYYRGGFGYMNQFFGEYIFLAGQIGMITAANQNNHLDLAAGLFINNSIGDPFPDNSLIPLSLSIAYRYQKPESKSYFKIGGGIFEGLQISGGFRF